MQYSELIRREILGKALSGEMTHSRLAEEYGVGRSTIGKWLRDDRHRGMQRLASKDQRPQSWNREQRLNALLETHALSDEEARRAAKARKDSKEELLQIIDAWAEAKRLEEFFADAERRAQDLPDEQRERTIERLRRARALIGSTNALERFDAWQAPEER